MMRLPALILLLLAATIHASTASPRKDDTATSNANNDQLVDENSHEPSKISLTINVPKTKPKTTASQVQYPKEKEQPSQAKVNSETQPPGANSRLNSQPEQTPGSLMTKRRQLIITKILEQPISDSYKILGLTPSATDEEIKERHHKILKVLTPLSNHPRAALAINRVNFAWSCLEKPVQRNLYDTECTSIKISNGRIISYTLGGI